MSNQSQHIQASSGNCQCTCQCSRPDTVPHGKFFKEFPSTWQAPDSFMSRCIFKICCFIFTFRGDLHWLHDFLKEGNNWEQLHGQYLTQLSYLSTVQGLLLATAAVFLSSNPPTQGHLDYTSDASYACLAESLVFSLFGLLFQLRAFATGFIFRRREAAEIIIERRWRIFWHLLGLVVPVIIFGISVVLMIIAILITGISSHSNTVRLYLIITFTFLSVCHLVSIIASPLYYHLSNLWIRVLKAERGYAVPGESMNQSL
ncbi:hypothetical protein DFH29DRAFT_296079 [Suillus ampliporus]|nr:hypothetical protein DFH29DRAFT_296079 [Suillus ampliporus]